MHCEVTGNRQPDEAEPSVSGNSQAFDNLIQRGTYQAVIFNSRNGNTCGVQGSGIMLFQLSAQASSVQGMSSVLQD